MSFKVGDVVYYKYRFVFADGHITRASLPDMMLPEGVNDRIDVTINLQKDLDYTTVQPSWPIVELYRSKNGNPFQLLERVKPSLDRTIRETSGGFILPDGSQIATRPTDTFYNPDEANPTITFVDMGESATLTTLQDVNPVFTERVAAQETVRDRTVLANITYPNVDIRVIDNSGNSRDLYGVTVNEQSPLLIQEDDSVYPSNVTVQLFAKAKFTDGTESVHFPVSKPALVRSLTADVTFNQQPNLNLSGEDIVDIGFYLNYQPQPIEETTSLKFSTNELANAQVETLASQYGNEPKNTPQNPRIWYGYKHIYVERYAYTDGPITNYSWVIRIPDADRNTPKRSNDEIEPENERISWFVLPSEVSKLPNPTTTFNLEANHKNISFKIVGDVERRYHLVGMQDDEGALANDFRDENPENFFSAFNGNPTTLTHRYVYRLADYDGLAAAADAGDLRVRIKNNVTISSNEVPSDKLLNEWQQVVGVLDTSAGADVSFSGTEFGIPGRNNVYLVLDSDSIYNKIDVGSVNEMFSRQTFSEQIWGNSQPDLSAVATFEIDGLEFIDSSVPALQEGAQSKKIRKNWRYGISIRDQQDLEGLIFVGRATWPELNGTDTIFSSGKLLYTGYDFTKENFLIRARLRSTNLYEKRVLTNNLRASQDEFPNQLIFSEPATNDLYSGARIFDYKNFIDVETTYGPILGLASTESILLLFTPRAVGFVRVGEALTRTASGETFVNTEQFLSSPQWAITTTNGYWPQSICKADTGLYFSDGRDLYVYSGGLNNLTNGVIDMSSADRIITNYDPLHKEILLTIGEQETYAYSIELKQWYGPYTHRINKNIVIGQDRYGKYGTAIVKYNTGDTFANSTYTVDIQAGSNDLGDASWVKTWRRMLLDYNATPIQRYTLELNGSSTVDITDGSTTYAWTAASFDTAVIKETDTGRELYRFKNGKTSPGLEATESGGTMTLTWLDTPPVFLGTSSEADFILTNEKMNTRVITQNKLTKVGIPATNSTTLFWRVASFAKDFVLRMVALDYFVRGRR